MANPLKLWRHRGYAALALVSLALTTGAFFYPLAAQMNLETEGALARMCYAPLCHQLPERSFHLFGLPLAVCERCTALYLGFTLTVLLAPFFRWNGATLNRLLLVALVLVLPMAADWLLDVMGLYANSMLSRTITGFFGGVGIAYIAVPAWLEATTRYPEQFS